MPSGQKVTETLADDDIIKDDNEGDGEIIPEMYLVPTEDEEQGVVSSSLDFDQLAQLILGFVREVAQNNTSSFDISKFKAKNI